VLENRRERFDLLYHAYSGRVLGYAIHRGMSIDEAEDVVAETFLVCWRRLDDMPREPLPWLLGVARKTLANRRRSNRRRDALHERLATQSPSNEPQFMGEESLPLRQAEIGQALLRLTEQDREAILLTALEGLSLREAAQVVECSPSAFAVRAFRARVRLRKSLEAVRTYECAGSAALEMEPP